MKRMNTTYFFGVLVMLAGVAVVAYRNQGIAGMINDALGGTADKLSGAVFDLTGVDLMDWQKVAAQPQNAQYVALMGTVESRHGLPRNILVRLAYQESHYRPDIISGRTVNSAGALGIMQIVPKWHPGVNPLDPVASINYAGQYLSTLFRMFGTWEHALQAYNWGVGNLQKYLAGHIATMPTETANYSGQILADLNSAGVTVA